MPQGHCFPSPPSSELRGKNCKCNKREIICSRTFEIVEFEVIGNIAVLTFFRAGTALCGIGHELNITQLK